MPAAFRIDDLVLQPDGRVEVRYTAGVTPLPAQWPGTAMVFGTKADVQRFVENSPLAWITPELMLRLAVSLWKQRDTDMVNPALMIGHTLTWNPGAAANVLVLS